MSKMAKEKQMFLLFFCVLTTCLINTFCPVKGQHGPYRSVHPIYFNANDLLACRFLDVISFSCTVYANKLLRVNS